MHDATKVLMGVTRSSDKAVGSFPADPATFVAGTAVRQKSDGGLSVTLAHGVLAGVSLGVDMSDTKKTAVCLAGDEVPIKLTDVAAAAYGTVTISSYANLIAGGGDDTITVEGVAFVAQAGAASLGDETFQAATSNEATATSLAAQINAHEDLEDLVLATVDGAIVTITALEEGTDGNSITLTLTEGGTGTGASLGHLSGGALSGGLNSYDYVVPGALVYVSDTTGLAGPTGSGYTVTGASYSKDCGPFDGVLADGTTVKAAVINMVGGL